MQVTTFDDSRPSRGLLVLILALVALPYFMNLGTPPLWDANEPLYAEPPKEVLEWDEGDFFAPTWNGETYWAHPPLSTWVTVPFYVVFGVSAWSERLPMAIAALLILLATFRLGRSLGGRRIGMWAAIVLAATPKFWLFSRQLSGDVYMTALLTWGFALALPSVGGQIKCRSMFLGHALIGFGWVAKGPVILVLYAGALFFAWLLGRPRGRWAELKPWRSLLWIVLLGAPWFVYMGIRFEDLFFEKHFGHYTFRRVMGDIGERGPLFYVRVLVGDAQPWITVLPFAGWLAWRAKDRRPEALLPWAVILWTIAFFSLSVGKRNVYMLPIYPFIAVAIAPLVQAVWAGAHRKGVQLAAFGCFVGCVGGALMLFLLGKNEPRLRPEIWWPLGIFALFAVPFLVAGWKGAGRHVTVGAMALVLCVQASVALSFPALARFRPVPLFAAHVALRQDKTQPEPVVIYRVSIHSMNFYLGRRTAKAASAEELRAAMGEAKTAFVLVPQHRFDAPGKRDGAPRRGLKHELPGATFNELARKPILTFRFDRSILGRGPTTRDLLLLWITLPK